MEKIRQRIFISIAIAAIIYLGFVIYVDYEKLISSFIKFNWLLLPVLLVLSLGNYIVRFFKWEYYLRIIQVRINRVDSFSIFMSGLIMSVTPGKMGELLKSYLIKQVISTPISKTAPIVLAERATDFLSLTIMALIGAYIFDYGKNVAIIIGIFLILGVIIFSNKTIFITLTNIISRINFISKYADKIQSAYDSSSRLLAIRPLLLMILVSTISWGFECIGYYIILKNFELNVSVVWSFFSYSFSTIVGAVSMLPGGLGVTEGSLTLMVFQKGLAENDAVATTFIIRVVTLWFAVLVGAISLLIYQKRFGKLEMNTGFETIKK